MPFHLLALQQVKGFSPHHQPKPLYFLDAFASSLSTSGRCETTMRRVSGALTAALLLLGGMQRMRDAVSGAPVSLGRLRPQPALCRSQAGFVAPSSGNRRDVAAAARDPGPRGCGQQSRVEVLWGVTPGSLQLFPKDL